MLTAIKSLLRSRKVIVAIVGGVVAYLGKLGYALDPELTAIITSTLIGAIALEDAARKKADPAPVVAVQPDAFRDAPTPVDGPGRSAVLL